MEVIEQTASEQWDALLEVAQKWARMDVPREDDTSEEEAEEEFIDDGEEEDTGKEEETDTRSVSLLYIVDGASLTRRQDDCLRRDRHYKPSRDFA